MTPVRIQARPPRGPASAIVLERSAEAISPHLEDAAHFPGGHAEGIARPRSERELAGLLMAVNRALVIGAQSSVTGGATPDGGLIISTERLTAFTDIDASRVSVGAGFPLTTLQTQLAASHRWYPPVPT